jgi:hypothetical protein
MDHMDQQDPMMQQHYQYHDDHQGDGAEYLLDDEHQHQQQQCEYEAASPETYNTAMTNNNNNVHCVEDSDCCIASGLYHCHLCVCCFASGTGPSCSLRTRRLFLSDPLARSVLKYCRRLSGCCFAGQGCSLRTNYLLLEPSCSLGTIALDYLVAYLVVLSSFLSPV